MLFEEFVARWSGAGLELVSAGEKTRAIPCSCASRKAQRAIAGRAKIEGEDETGRGFGAANEDLILDATGGVT